MQYKKPLLVAGAITTIGMAGFGTFGVASAATPNTTTDKPGTSSIIDKIATKFHLDRNDVKAVFDEDQAERRTEHQHQIETELNQAVTEGKLTAAQKQAILDKITELESQHDSEGPELQNKTEAQLRALKKQSLKDIQDWATANNIPQGYLGYIFGGPAHSPGGMDKFDAKRSFVSGQEKADQTPGTN